MMPTFVELGDTWFNIEEIAAFSPAMLPNESHWAVHLRNGKVFSINEPELQSKLHALATGVFKS